MATVDQIAFSIRLLHFLLLPNVFRHLSLVLKWINFERQTHIYLFVLSDVKYIRSVQFVACARASTYTQWFLFNNTSVWSIFFTHIENRNITHTRASIVLNDTHWLLCVMCVELFLVKLTKLRWLNCIQIHPTIRSDARFYAHTFECLKFRLNHKPKWHSIILNEFASCDSIHFDSALLCSARLNVINLHVCLDWSAW